jgi:hypothetical protein
VLCWKTIKEASNEVWIYTAQRLHWTVFATLAMLVLILIGSTSTVILFFVQLNWVALLLLISSSVATIFILQTISLLMSTVYNNSIKVRANLALCISNLPSKDDRYFYKRQLRSLSVIRCHVGLYHMESKAKLTLFDTIIQGIVFVLLL